MDELKVAARRLVVADTGPLLCAGAFERSMGTTLLHKRKGLIHIPAAVESELRGHARPSRGGDSEVVRNAALKILSPGPWGLLIVAPTAPSEAERLPVREAVIAAETALADRRGQAPKLTGHHGEVDAILLAEKHNAILLTNDHAALVVAASRGLSVTTFGGLLAADLASGLFTAIDAIAECRRLEGEVYCGLRTLNVLTLTETPVPEGLRIDEP